MKQKNGENPLLVQPYEQAIHKEESCILLI